MNIKNQLIDIVEASRTGDKASGGWLFHIYGSHSNNTNVAMCLKGEIVHDYISLKKSKLIPFTLKFRITDSGDVIFLKTVIKTIECKSELIRHQIIDQLAVIFPVLIYTGLSL